MLEPAGVNPYKLVYKVTKFVYQHKVPLRRSAFTYCTEELPSRMDVGKHKYGGLYSTKQVEDVKAFWGILKVVLSIGPAFLLQTTTQSILPAFARHSNIFLDKNSTNQHQFHIEGVGRHILISNGLLSPLLVIICIPFHLCWIRPHILYRIPGVLKRMGLAVVIMIISLICTCVMDLVVHMKNTEALCMFQIYVQSSPDPFITYSNFPSQLLFQNVYFFTSQHVLSAVANMLLDIAVLEFICSQSPHSMKGLLLGIFFSVKSLFQGIAVAFIVPFGAAWRIHSLSCGSGFYLINIILGVLELVLFMHIAKRYKYREVNEPSHEYRYAENYYSNIQ
jgi:peptide/histidine transporter 3/4